MAISLSNEQAAWDQDKGFVGIDEAGYGCAFGSMWVAMVRFPKNFKVPKELLVVRDSKKFTSSKAGTAAAERYLVATLIKQYAEEFAVLEVTADQINSGNPYWLRYSVVEEELKSWTPGITMFDGNVAVKAANHENKCMIKGDAYCFSIAAASVLAKSAKDQEMQAAAKLYPWYDLANNQGYLTASHQAALKQYGAVELHRTSYVKNHL